MNLSKRTVTVGQATTVEPAATSVAAKKGEPFQRSAYIGLAVVAVAVVVSYYQTLALLVHVWTTEADYSHGFLVPVFSGFLLWHRRAMYSPSSAGGTWWGLLLIALAGVVRWTADFYFYPLLGPPSLLPCLAGVAVLAGGKQALKWSWPAIVFLIFMIPLPGAVAGLLSNPLQSVATASSTWLLQTFGVPAMARGNVIVLSEHQIGVVEACSGLRMLMLFVAITVGASFVIERKLWEKILISVSAMVIGLITNILRITVTAFVYEYIGKYWGDKVFHDLAGWLMMPAATLLLMLELFVLSKLLIERPNESGPILVHR